jgi:hypothetical protein
MSARERVARRYHRAASRACDAYAIFAFHGEKVPPRRHQPDVGRLARAFARSDEPSGKSGQSVGDLRQKIAKLDLSEAHQFEKCQHLHLLQCCARALGYKYFSPLPIERSSAL